MEPELQPGGRESPPGPFHRPAHGCLALVIKPSLALALPTEKFIWLSFQPRTCQTNLNRKFYLKTQAPWVADPGLTCASIFTPKHAFSPRSLIWNLKAACSILGPTSGLGGVIEAVCTHRLLCPLPSALPTASPPVCLFLPSFIHITSRTIRGSGRRRPQAWEGKLWPSTACGFPLSPERPTPITEACVRRGSQPFSSQHWKLRHGMKSGTCDNKMYSKTSGGRKRGNK